MTAGIFKTVKLGVILAAYVGVCTLLMAGTYTYVKTDIESSRLREKRMLIEEIVPLNLLAQHPSILPFTVPPNELLGTLSETTGYRVCLGRRVVGIVLEASTFKGYSGKIQLIVGVRSDGSVMGVRVVGHKETPGVGDYIAEKPVPGTFPVWVDQFVGKKLTASNAKRWAVKKDGGVFDYVAGATISPRAVVDAVRQVLQYVDTEKNALFNKPGGCTPFMP